MAFLLLVDDEPYVLRAVHRMLVRRGIPTIATPSPEDALQLLQTNDVSCILSDYRMPTMTGVALLSRARVLRPRAGRVIMTGQADARALAAARADGTVHRVVDKPFTHNDLLAAMVEARSIAQTITESRASL